METPRLTPLEILDPTSKYPTITRTLSENLQIASFAAKHNMTVGSVEDLLHEQEKST